MMMMMYIIHTYTLTRCLLLEDSYQVLVVIDDALGAQRTEIQRVQFVTTKTGSHERLIEMIVLRRLHRLEFVLDRKRHLVVFRIFDPQSVRILKASRSHQHKEIALENI